MSKQYFIGFGKKWNEMLVACPNDVKVYDLSSGKSLPEWISDRKRRKLLQKDVDLRRRIQLIQDFEMPDCSNDVCLSRDEQFIFVSGVYKPRVRCYDVNNLSLKFERCLDSEPIKLIPLSDGYEKFIVIEEDRWIEFHVQYGHYCKLRLPKFCRGASYIDSAAELYIAGSGSEVYRLNLETGRFMPPLTTDGMSLTSCDANPFHQLFVCGTTDGQVEAWDPRSHKCVGKFDVPSEYESLPLGADNGVSCLKFKNQLELAVGTGWGKIFMYDIRSNKPHIVKDHQYDLPIKAIDFSSDSGHILSIDSKVLKVWNNDTRASTVASIEPGLALNGLCLYPKSGLLFLPNEGQKVFSYFLPSLGPAPRWCSFLDSITEELEETETPAVYDDYKFLTMEELEQLGLSNLIGTNILRAYMHGYFCDARLYNKAKALTNPFAFDEYRKTKIREKMDEERRMRVVPTKKLPSVNRQLAERLLEEEEELEGDQPKNKSKKKQKASRKANLLKDDRFRAMFENPEFEVDPDNEDAETMNPVLVQLARVKNKAKKSEDERIQRELDEEMLEFQSKLQNEGYRDESAASSDIEEMDDDQEEEEESGEEPQEAVSTSMNKPSSSKEVQRKSTKVVTVRSDDEFRGWKYETDKNRQKQERMTSLGDRLLAEEQHGETTELSGNAKEMTFSVRKKRDEIREKKLANHVRERRQARRPAAGLGKKGSGRRVR